MINKNKNKYNKKKIKYKNKYNKIIMSLLMI